MRLEYQLLAHIQLKYLWVLNIYLVTESMKSYFYNTFELGAGKKIVEAKEILFFALIGHPISSIQMD